MLNSRYLNLKQNSVIQVIIKEQFQKFAKQVCIPVGCVPPACWPYLPARTVQGRVSAPGGVSGPRGGGAPGGRGSAIPACTEAAPPPREQNDRQVQKYYLGPNFPNISLSNKGPHETHLLF